MRDNFHTVCCLKITEHTVLWKNNEKFNVTKIFRQINSFFSKNVTFHEILLKICARQNRSNYHTVEITEFCCHDFFAKIPSNHFFAKEVYSLSCFDGKKLRGSDFFVFLHCAHSQSGKTRNSHLKNISSN